MSEQSSSLPEILSEIKKYASENPNYVNTIITELHSIVNKYDPDIKTGKKEALPLVDPSFKPKVKQIKENIFQKIGYKIKIPDLRFEAIQISHKVGIPLPNATRKNNEALMQWFESNWEVLEPNLSQIKAKPRSQAAEN